MQPRQGLHLGWRTPTVLDLLSAAGPYSLSDPGAAIEQFRHQPRPNVPLLNQPLCTCVGAGSALKEPSPAMERKSALTFCHTKSKRETAEE